ncbi:MAG TPA: CBS domain-containing protein [Kofleriaceae bacterium]
MRAQDLMTRSPVTCHVNDTLYTAAKQMWDYDCGVVAVVNDDGVLTGMITDRDICMAAYTQALPLHSLLVNGAMAKHVVTARPETSLQQVEELMASHRIRRIPIIDDAGKPIGIVSMNDIVLESAQPDSQMTNGAAKVTHTLAAICEHRRSSEQATQAAS